MERLSSSMLPQDIIEDILVRLPVKSIGRFRCVSKPWRALLSQPEFIETHFSRTIEMKKETLLLISDSRDLFNAVLSTADNLVDAMTDEVRKHLSFAGHPDSRAEIIGFCSGLALVEDKTYNKFLINQTTREISEVPVSPFALDPDISFSLYGLGYDLVNADYKVVAISYFDSYYAPDPDCTDVFVNVYSVRNGTWKKIEEGSPYDHACADSYISGASVNGRIHWLASAKTTDYPSVIAAFDLSGEVFYEVPPPSSLEKDKFVFGTLFVLGGCLSLLRSWPNGDTSVFMMKEYDVKESWNMFTVTIDPSIDQFRPLSLLGGQEQVAVVKDADKIDDVFVFPVVSGNHRVGIRVSFVESLISPCPRMK